MTFLQELVEDVDEGLTEMENSPEGASQRRRRRWENVQRRRKKKKKKEGPHADMVRVSGSDDKVRQRWRSDSSGEEPQRCCAPQSSKQKAEEEQRRSLTLTGRPSDDLAETGNRKCDP